MEYPQNLTVSERRWSDLIQQCRASGKSDAQWLQEHEIKSPTFYYHVKQLRKKASDIPENSFSRQRNDVQEVVPLFMDEAPSIMTNNNPSASSSITDNTAAVRLKVLDKGTIKQLKIQGPTYDKTPPLETMSGVLRTWENCGGH